MKKKISNNDAKQTVVKKKQAPKKSPVTAKVAKSSKLARKPSPNRGSKPGEHRGGRKKGTPNKVTQDTRIAVQKIVEGNIEKIQSWIDRVARKDPEAAANIVLKLLEYHVPKLQRTDHTSGDLPIDPVVNIYVRGVAPPKRNG